MGDTIEWAEQIVARFWSYITIGDMDQCWEWKRGRFTNGYGQFRMGKRKLKAHRVAFELTNNRQTKKHASGCLLWCGSHYPTGYGSFWIDGRVQSAHRASWLIFKGLIPAGLYVLHHCDVRLCVNAMQDAKLKSGLRPSWKDFDRSFFTN